jgi:hypothetical protein
LLGKLQDQCDGAQKRVQNVRLTVAAVLVALVAGFWLGWAAGRFVAQDRCLDAGGSWNDALGSCRFAK